MLPEEFEFDLLSAVYKEATNPHRRVRSYSKFFHKMVEAPEIDFQDMIYLPAVSGWDMSGQLDVAFCDEFQDLDESQVRILLALKCRVILVGDVKQAIYGFRSGGLFTLEELVARF
jgi:superfamily I DNA/RNA helicase